MFKFLLFAFFVFFPGFKVLFCHEHISASNTVINGVTNWVTHRIFNRNW